LQGLGARRLRGRDTGIAQSNQDHSQLRWTFLTPAAAACPDQPNCRCPASGTYPNRCTCPTTDDYYPNCDDNPDDPVVDSTGSSSPSSSGSALSGGAIAGIVIITLVGVVVIAYVWWYFFSARGEVSRLQHQVPIPGLLSAPAVFGASTESDVAYQQQGL
jgi:hypothetical protein